MTLRRALIKAAVHAPLGSLGNWPVFALEYADRSRATFLLMNKGGGEISPDLEKWYGREWRPRKRRRRWRGI